MTPFQEAERVQLPTGEVLHRSADWVGEVAPGEVSRAKVFTGRHLRVLVSDDSTPHGVLRHASVSRRDRLPSWEEVRAVRNCFFDQKSTDVMMMLPREADYVNFHPFCLHLYETPQEWRVR